MEFRSIGEEGYKIRQLDSISHPVSWQPPLKGVIKINVDAALPQNMSVARLGVVLRNSDSKVLGAAQKACNFHVSALQAEVMALYFALQIGKEFGCKKIGIESDCFHAVHIAKSEEECFLPFGVIVEDLHAKKSFYDCLCFSHIKREFNVLAHNLAQLLTPAPQREGVWFGTLVTRNRDKKTEKSRSLLQNSLAATAHFLNSTVNH